MYWRVHVAEIPLVCRDLAIWLHVPLPREQIQLFLRKPWVHNSER